MKNKILWESLKFKNRYCLVKLIGERKLNSKQKTAITAITLTILLAIPMAITIVNAQDEYFGPIKTFAYVGAYPTPIGV